KSCGNWGLEQASAVSLPSAGAEVYGCRTTHARFWEPAFQASMRAMSIIGMLEIDEFAFQVGCGPEQASVQELASDCADQALHKRMRQGDVGNGLSLGHIEHSKVCLPLMESVQRIMIRTEIFGQGSAVDRSGEHPTQRRTVNDSTMNAEPDD